MSIVVHLDGKQGNAFKAKDCDLVEDPQLVHPINVGKRNEGEMHTLPKNFAKPVDICPAIFVAHQFSPLGVVKTKLNRHMEWLDGSIPRSVPKSPGAENDQEGAAAW
jgi:hypothetical protein